MNSEILFSLALGLQSPWQVNDVTFSTDESARSELHLHIDFISGSRFPDEANVACPVHDTVERQWQHLSFFEHTCYLHCAVPRITTTDGVNGGQKPRIYGACTKKVLSFYLN